MVPTTPSALALAPSSDQDVANDGITNVATPTITGLGIAGASVQLFEGSTPVGNAVVAQGGTWSIVAATALEEGSNTLTATETDPFGTVSGASPALAVTRPRRPGHHVGDGLSIGCRPGFWRVRDPDTGIQQASGGRRPSGTPILILNNYGVSVVTRMRFYPARAFIWSF